MIKRGLFPAQPNHNKTAVNENHRLKKELQQVKKRLLELTAQYQALEEDFLHLLDSQQPPNLKGRKFVYIGASPTQIKSYKAIVQHYQGELITPESDQVEAICKAIQLADEVLCPNDCPNQALCQAARSSCTRFNKPLTTIENTSPQGLQEALSKIEIECFHPERLPNQ